MFPNLELFAVRFPTYGVFYASAFLAGLWLVGRQAKRECLEPFRIQTLVASSVLVSRIASAFINAILCGTTVTFRVILESTGAFFWVLISGITFFLVGCKIKKVPVLN